jgi:long-subunit acyl-CoA synthetase (AMP-forming)
MQQRAATGIPMPSFFSDAQPRHLVADAGLEVIITDQPERALYLSGGSPAGDIGVAGTRLACIVTAATQRRAVPSGVTRITYTSGTTGRPKGVCLTSAAMQRVTVSLAVATGATGKDRSLALLPFSTLLANIAGIYAPLYCGGTACVPNLFSAGIKGSTGVDTAALFAALHHYAPTVTVLVPQLLKVLVEAAEAGAPPPPSLRYLAVGGAPVSPLLLRRARTLGFPVYQGYGLSEAASVVSMNAPGKDRIDSVGRPLPHARVRVAADGEIMVGGSMFAAYLGQPLCNTREWASGDIGFLDSDGYLYITGRKKTAYATAYGRKLAPEWIESELTATPVIAQAAVFGEARSFNVAVIVPRDAAAVPRVGAAIESVNQTLPDYARIQHWCVTDEPFSTDNGLASATGGPDRQAVATLFSGQIERMYEGEHCLAIL